MKYLSSINTPSLLEEQWEQCVSTERDLRITHIHEKSKSPGNNSFAKELYVAFLVNLENQCLIFSTRLFKRDLSVSKQAVVTLPRQKDQDVTVYKELETNTTVKGRHEIASKVVAIRIRKLVLLSHIQFVQIIMHLQK